MAGPVDLDILSQSPMLAGLPRDELEQLAATMRSRRYRRGEVIFHEGDPGETLHLVCQGHLKAVLPAESGEEAVLRIISPGQIFGEMALLDGAPRSATVVALEPVETASLSRRDFVALLGRSPAAVDGLLAGLAQMIRSLTAEVGDLVFLDPQGRFAKKLLELVETHGRPLDGGAIEIDLTLTLEELAAMIGTTRQTISKILAMYVAQRAIARHGRRICVLKPDTLRGRIVV